MNEPRTAVLAFLAGRYPAAYSAGAVAQRVGRSGLVDGEQTADSARAALRALHALGLARADADPVSGEVYWSASEKGVRQWSDAGRIHVG
jgi:hypothetical protein